MMAAQTSQIGDLNRNGQKLVAQTSAPGNDHNARVWVVECTMVDCGHRYGVNGTDFFQRKCPKCQSGERGLSIEGLQ